MEITLTKVYRTNKNKDGSPLMGKNGKNYERVGIKAQEYGDQWISGFGGSWNQYWKEGDKVNVNIIEVASNGKTFLNFEKVDELQILRNKIEVLEHRVYALENISKQIDVNDPELDQIPF